MLDIGIFYFVCSIKPKCFLSEFFVLTVCMPNVCFFSYVKKTYLKSNFLHVLLFRVAQYFVFLAVFYCFLCSTKKFIDIENIEKSIFVLFMNYFHFSLSGPKKYGCPLKCLIHISLYKKSLKTY